MLTCIFLVLAFTGLSVRLVYVQIVKHDEYAERATRQRSHKIVLPGHRGRIFDAGGELLVDNFPTQDVFADRYAIRDIRNCVRGLAHAQGLKPKALRSLYDDEDIRQRYAARLAHVVSGAVGQEAGDKILEMAKEDSRRRRVPLAPKLDHDVARRLAKILKEEKLAGINFEDSIRRFYPNPRALGHVLGWTDHTGAGKAGVEGVLDARLGGRDGSRLVERDGHSDEIAIFRGETIEPVDGEDVFLTVRMPLQNIVENALDRLVEKHHPERAIAIFMDPITGEILALANRPDFNLATREGNRRNFALSDRCELGSVMKMVTLAACYDSGAVTPGEQIFCHNGIYNEGPGFKPFKDHHPYGYLSTGMVLAKSSNIGTYMMAKELGKHTLYTYFRDFGFGSRTGLALTGEVDGLVHKPNSPYWSKTSLSRVGIGYEIDVTPLQMLNAMCVVANGGYLMQPQIVSKITDAHGEPTYELRPHKVRRVISEETADQVRRDMMLVVGEHGTGKLGVVEGYSQSAKTGTARKPNKDRSKGYMTGRYVVSYMAFLPAENPRLAGIIVVDDPTGAGVSRFGGTVAAPVFSEIATAAMKSMGVEPSVVPRRAVRTREPLATLQYVAPVRPEDRF